MDPTGWTEGLSVIPLDGYLYKHPNNENDLLSYRLTTGDLLSSYGGEMYMDLHSRRRGKQRRSKTNALIWRFGNLLEAFRSQA